MKAKRIILFFLLLSTPFLAIIPYAQCAEGDYIDTWSTAPNALNAMALTNYDGYILVLDYASDTIHNFTTEGAWISSFGIGGQAPGPRAITTDGNFIWAFDSTGDQVYKYTMDGTYTTLNWDTLSADDSMGMCTDGNYIWINDYSDKEVYRFSMDGVYVDSWDTSGEVSGTSRGITTDGTNFWIADLTNMEVYKYNMTGGYIDSWDTSVELLSTYGITNNVTHIFIMDLTSDAVYIYEGPPPSIFPPSDPIDLFGAGFNASSPYVELHWNHTLVDVQFFEVQNSTDKVTWAYLGSNTTAEYTDLQVVNGTERYYRVRACNFTDGNWYNSSFTDINFEKVYFIPIEGEYDGYYLGEFIDDYENTDNVSAAYNVINNETLDCMELYYSTGLDPYENFTEWIESDIPNRLSQTDLRSTFTNLARSDSDVYLYRDFGIDYFIDFSHNFVLRINAITQTARLWRAAAWTMATGLGDFQVLRNNNDEAITLHIDNPNIANKFYIELRECINGAMWFTNMNNLDVGVTYFITVMRVGTNFTCQVYSDSARLNLIESKSLILQAAYSYQYLMVPESLDYTFADLVTGYVENFTGIAATDGYVDNGYYYTNELLGNDTTLVLLYNATIETDTGIEAEFSRDNVTWVDHNNQAGSDTLVTGYESLDLRDLNTTSLYIRFNMTSNGEDTPRIYQIRLITLTNVTLGNGNGEAVYVDTLFPGLAIGIALLIIGAIYVYASENRG